MALGGESYEKQFVSLLGVYVGLVVLSLFWQYFFVDPNILLHTVIVAVIVIVLFLALNYFAIRNKTKCLFYVAFIIDAILAVCSVIVLVLGVYHLIVMVINGGGPILSFMLGLALRVCFSVVLCLMCLILWNHREDLKSSSSIV